jgi:hypothetical protein
MTEAPEDRCLAASEEIGEAFRALLCGRTSAGDNVLLNPPDPFWQGSERTIMVHTIREDPIELVGTAPIEYRRHLEVWVDAYGGDTRTDPTDTSRPRASDQSGSLVQEVESVLLPNLWLRGELCPPSLVIDEQHTRLLRWERAFEAGDRVVFASRHTLVIAYRTTVLEVDTRTLPLLETLGVNVDLPESPDGFEAQVEIDTSGS